jgi:hypothetical protein
MSCVCCLRTTTAHAHIISDRRELRVGSVQYYKLRNLPYQIYVSTGLFTWTEYMMYATRIQRKCGDGCQFERECDNTMGMAPKLPR